MNSDGIILKDWKLSFNSNFMLAISKDFLFMIKLTY